MHHSAEPNIHQDLCCRTHMDVLNGCFILFKIMQTLYLDIIFQKSQLRLRYKQRACLVSCNEMQQDTVGYCARRALCFDVLNNIQIDFSLQKQTSMGCDVVNQNRIWINFTKQGELEPFTTSAGSKNSSPETFRPSIEKKNLTASDVNQHVWISFESWWVFKQPLGLPVNKLQTHFIFPFKVP